MMQSAFMLSGGWDRSAAPVPTQGGITFPMPLSEKYRPKTLDGFAGLDRARAVMTAFVRKPYESAWLFLGASGTGKTSHRLDEEWKWAPMGPHGTRERLR